METIIPNNFFIIVDPFGVILQIMIQLYFFSKFDGFSIKFENSNMERNIGIYTSRDFRIIQFISADKS